jgi:hypothetical protein
MVQKDLAQFNQGMVDEIPFQTKTVTEMKVIGLGDGSSQKSLVEFMRLLDLERMRTSGKKSSCDRNLSLNLSNHVENTAGRSE